MYPLLSFLFQFGFEQGAPVGASRDRKSLDHVPISHSQGQALYREIDY